MGLKGKTVLVTRQPEQAREFIEEIEKRGGRVVLFPTIKISDPASWDLCDAAIAGIGGYHALLFTSANAVERFFARCADLEVDIAAFKPLEIFTVGEKTKEEVERQGLSVTAVPDEYSGKSLAAHLASGDVQRKRFLFLRGNLSRDEVVDGLTALGVIVDSAVVYETSVADSGGADTVLDQLHAGQIDVVTFASPSAVVNFQKLLGDGVSIRGKTKVAAIGPTTAEAVRFLGIDVDIVAPKSTMKSLAEAIDRYFD